MASKDHEIWCTACHKRWQMTTLGQLQSLDGQTEFSHILIGMNLKENM